MISHPFHFLKKFLTCRFSSSYSHNGFEIWLMLQVYKLRAAPPACVSSPREASGFGFNGVYLSLHRSGLPGPPSAERILGVHQSLHRSGVLLALRRRGRVTLWISSTVNQLCAAFSSSPFMVLGSACKEPLLMLVALLIDQSVVLLINLVV